MKRFEVAVYAEGTLYPWYRVQRLTPEIHKAGWDRVILGLFHIGRPDAGQTEGDLLFNDTPIISQGQYVGDPAWPKELAKLHRLGVKLSASFGGARPWVKDFETLHHIYMASGESLAGTNFERCFRKFVELFPFIDLIDVDNEDLYDVPSLIAWLNMMGDLGLKATFCPYEEAGFWVKCLSLIEKRRPGLVVRWNLQCYAGGDGQRPEIWARAIKEAMPKFHTDRYFSISDWSRFFDHTWQGHNPSEVATLMKSLRDPSVSGAFLWNLDQIVQYETDQESHPDAGGPGGDGHAYVEALRAGST